MANQFQSIASGFAVLKDVFHGTVVDQFNEDVVAFRRLQKVTEGWDGYRIIKSLKVARNTGIGATSDGGTLPAIGRQTNAQCIMTSAFNYLRCGITGPMMKASRTDKGSFVRDLAYEMEQGMNDLRSDVNRQVGWTGNGWLAELNANAVASTTVDVIGRVGVTESGAKFLATGMVVDFVTPASPAVVLASQITITGLVTVGAVTTLTLSAPVTVSDGDKIVRAGSEGNEIAGLLACQDGGTGVLNNISRTTYPIYQGNLFDLNGAQLTTDDMEGAITSARERGNSKIEAILCDFPSQRFYQKLLTPDKRYVNVMEGDGGFTKKGEKYLTFDGFPLIPDKDFSRSMLFIDPASYINFVLAEMEYADETGSVTIAQSETDAFEARLRYFTNIMPVQPNLTARLTNYISP